jgi:hypothetical protein
VDALNIALKNKYYWFTAVHGSLLDFDANLMLVERIFLQRFFLIGASTEAKSIRVGLAN